MEKCYLEFASYQIRGAIRRPPAVARATNNTIDAEFEDLKRFEKA